MTKPRANFTLRIELDLLEKVTAAAAEEGIPRNAYIVTKLRRTLSKKRGD